MHNINIYAMKFFLFLELNRRSHNEEITVASNYLHLGPKSSLSENYNRACNRCCGLKAFKEGFLRAFL